MLIVTSAAQGGEGLPAGPASVELLHARGADEAIEKLGRNRRIDGVLLAAGPENPAIARAIREDNPAPPPLLEADAGADLQEALDRLLAKLEG